MGIGYFVTAKLFDCMVQRTFAQLGTERARILFFPFLKNDLIDLGRDDRIMYAQLLTQCCYRGEIQIFVSQVDSNCFYLKMLRIEAGERL